MKQKNRVSFMDIREFTYACKLDYVKFRETLPFFYLFSLISKVLYLIVKSAILIL